MCPKAPVARELLLLSNRITRLKTYEQSNEWLADLYHWYEKARSILMKKPLTRTRVGFGTGIKCSIKQPALSLKPYLICFIIWMIRRYLTQPIG
jgi:hypothetical protein